MSQRVPFDKFSFPRIVCYNKLLEIPDDSNTACFLQVDLRYPYYIGQKKRFPFAPEKKLYAKMISSII